MVSKIKKYIIFSLIIAVLTSIFLSGNNVVFAATSGDYSYNIYADGNVQIHSYTGDATEIVVPSTIDGHTVTIVTNLCKDNSNIVSVTIPEGIKEISYYTFYNCPNLTTVNIPSTVNFISNIFSYNCPNLVNYTVPSHLKLMNNGDYNAVCNVTIDGTYDYEKALEIVKLTNEHRVSQGKEELVVDNDLTEYAMFRAAELALYFSHTCASTNQIATKAENIGIATYIITAEGAVEAWKNSSGHNTQMLKDTHNSIGVGYFTANSKSYFIQVFSSNESTNNTTKTGQVEVKDKSMLLDSTGGLIDLTIKGIATTNTLNVGEQLSVESVKLINQGYTYNSIYIKASDLNWVSSNKEVFTVNDEGTISAVGSGTATLTATLGDFSKEFTIQVSKGQNVEGTIKSYGDKTAETTIQLIKLGDTDASYETSITGNDTTYSIENVTAGTYKLKVMKDNHATSICEIVVSDNKVTQDMKIHLIGDINGDGKINVTDVSKINAHAKGVSLLTNYEFNCADIDENGKINVTDVSRVNTHAKGVSLLW